MSSGGEVPGSFLSALCEIQDRFTLPTLESDEKEPNDEVDDLSLTKALPWLLSSWLLGWGIVFLVLFLLNP